MFSRLTEVATLRNVGAAVLALVASLVSADPQPHPRLWLDDAAMTRMEAARVANTPEWQTLRNWCDLRLGSNLAEGYQYLDWYSYVHNYGLMYQITGDDRYGNEGVKYLKALLRDRHAIGDGLGGTNAIQIDSGYVSRSMGVGVAVGRDWLDGAPDLTPELIEECTTRMNEWYAWIHRPQTYGISEPWVNYFAGHFAMTYTAFIAFEGDPGYSPAWETKSEQMWVLSRDLMNTALEGGNWTEGWNYGHRALRHMLAYPWALETGTDRPNHWDEIDITSEIVRAQVSMLHPSRAMLADDGRWTGDYKGDPRATTCLMMSVLSDTDPEAKGLARWFAANLTFQPGGPDRWEGLLFTDRSIAPITPTAATVGGLTWKMYGEAVSRSDDWSNLDATFVDVIAWPDYASEHNFGELKITSRQEQLLVDGQTWQLGGEFTNMPRINGGHTYAPYQELWHEDSIMTVDSEDTVYTYFKLAKLKHLYDGRYDDTPSVAYYNREIVFMPPDHVVVLDNIRASSLTNTITEQWHVMGTPSLSGDTAVVTRPNAKLFLRTVSPAVNLTTVNTNANRAGTRRVHAALVTPAIVNHIVTVFEAAPASRIDMTPLETITAPGLTGQHIKSLSGTPSIVLFATGENAALTDVAFNFTPVAEGTRVVITGVEPGVGFDVVTTPGSAGSYDVAVTRGSQVNSAANGSLTFIVQLGLTGVDDWQLD